MTAYATRRDVYAHGLPRGALGNPGRLVGSCLAAMDTIELEEHGFETGDAFSFRVPEGGTLSTPLVAGVLYYAIKLTDSTFKVSATPSGAAIDLTTDGVSVMVAADLPFDTILEFYSRWVDAFLPAEAVPLATPYPITVVGIVARLAAKQLQLLSGVSSDAVHESELAAKAQLERWIQGLPVRDASPTNIRTNLAVTNSRPADRIGVPVFGRTGGPSDNGGFE